MVTFTIFLLETPVAEVLAKVWSLVYPDWNMTIGTTCIFAAFMVLLWWVVVWLWSKRDFRFSVEWFLARGFRRAGRETQKDKAYRELEWGED